MRRNVYVRVALVSSCFVLAALKIKELLRGPGNYSWQDLFYVGAFIFLALFYLYLIWKTKNNPSS